MTTSQTAIVNGVDIGKLSATIAAVQADPSIARFQFRVYNQWVGGGENRSRIDDFTGANQELRHRQPFFLVNDEPEVLLSEDRGANPVEYLLHALAGCLTTSLVYHAAARGIAVKGIATHFEGDADLRGFLGLSENVRRGFSEIRVRFDIDAECGADEKRALVAMAETYSPVFDMLTNGVPVACTLDEQPQAEHAQAKAA
jgi:uncharacterized OsmC-like protein